LELGRELTELTKQQPPEIQQSLREMSRKTYPESAPHGKNKTLEVQR
jgi:hypothetical protein